MLDWIYKRRSIRRYTERDISDTMVTDLLQAAMAAPSANNRQDWEFVVLRDPAVRQAVAQAHPYGKMIAEAPVAIAVIASDPTHKYWEQDVAAAIENLLLAATTMGLGAVWLGMKDADRIRGVRAAIGLPDDKLPAALIPLGYPAENPPARSQYDPTKVFADRYGQPRKTER